MSSQNKNSIPGTQDLKIIKKFLKSQPEAKVEQSNKAFNRKIIKRQESLTQADNVLLLSCVANAVLVTLGLGFAFRVLYSKKLRSFSAYRWILGIGGMYAVGKPFYDLPARMAFADYVQKQRISQLNSPENTESIQEKIINKE